MPKRILLVGHCGVDGPRLQKEIASQLGAIQADRVNSMDDLTKACADGANLLLINREPVGFAPLMGVDLIREPCEQYPGQKVILVSDLEDAQEEATKAGALPGFGKADLDSPKFTRTIKSALGA